MGQKSKSILFTLVVLGGVVGFLHYTGSLKFILQAVLPAATWDGKEPLDCGGSQTVTIKDRAVENTKEFLGGMGGLISAGGSCSLKIVNCKIKALVAITAGGDATVRIEGGEIEGIKTGVDVGGSAKVVIEGAKIVGGEYAINAGGDGFVAYRKSQIAGKIKKGGAIVTELKEGEDLDRVMGRLKATSDLYKRYSANACAGVIKCYEDAGAFGQISGRIAMKIDASGKVIEVSQQLPGAPEAVARCVKSRCSQKTIADFKGPTGKVVCEYAGTITSGSQMLQQGGGFVPDSEGGS